MALSFLNIFLFSVNANQKRSSSIPRLAGEEPATKQLIVEPVVISHHGRFNADIRSLLATPVKYKIVETTVISHHGQTIANTTNINLNTEEKLFSINNTNNQLSY